jgi:hypothetical protein
MNAGGWECMNARMQECLNARMNKKEGSSNEKEFKPALVFTCP